MNKAVTIAIMFCLTSFTGCLGGDDDTTTSNAEEHCEADPWLFVMTGLILKLSRLYVAIPISRI